MSCKHGVEGDTFCVECSKERINDWDAIQKPVEIPFRPLGPVEPDLPLRLDQGPTRLSEAFSGRVEYQMWPATLPPTVTSTTFSGYSYSDDRGFTWKHDMAITLKSAMTDYLILHARMCLNPTIARVLLRAIRHGEATISVTPSADMMLKYSDEEYMMAEVVMDEHPEWTQVTFEEWMEEARTKVNAMQQTEQKEELF